MTFAASRALAVELRPYSPTQWIATYYPMVETPAGRWAEVTWVLHQCLMSATQDLPEPARWLEVRSPDPAHCCYTNHQAWSQALTAGYVAALAAYDAEDVEKSLSLEDAQRLREGTVVIPVGQLSEWMLNDLENEISDVRN